MSEIVEKMATYFTSRSLGFLPQRELAEAQ